MIFRVFLVCCAVLLCFPVIIQAQGQKNWAAEYNRLSKRIQEHWPEPKGSPNQLGPYLHWMEVKAQDRDQVDGLLQEVNALSLQNPEDQELDAWVQKFFDLSRKAKDSGDATVNGAVLKFMRSGAGTRNDQWPAVVAELKDRGRRILLKARETRFSTKKVIDHARCMIRFATADIEIGELAIWSGRDAFLGWVDEEGSQRLPSGDFHVECSRRVDQTVTADGEPRFPMDEALEKTKMIRDEAEWWQFQAELKDVIDLENAYYEDALCQEPPHKEKMGHDWFRHVAEGHELGESVEYNKGFYGTLFGTVQVRMPDGDQPASGARVTVKSGGETWSANAGQDGGYEMQKVVLHEACSPHNISAVYEGDRVDETYDGPLSEPDTNARHRKDLLIIPSTIYAWTGSLRLRSSKELHCEAQKDGPGDAKRTLSRHESRVQYAEIQVYAEEVDETEAGLSLQSGRQIQVTGTMRSRITNNREQHFRSGSDERRILERSSMKGSSSSKITDDNLILQIIGSRMMGSARSMQEVVQQFQQGAISPEEFQKKMEGLTQPDQEDSFEVDVLVQVTVAGTGTVILTDYRKVYDKGESEVEKDDVSSKTMPIAVPLSVTMKGTYTKGKNGRASISASGRKQETSPPGGVWDCPHIVTTTTGSLTLTRSKKKRPEK